MAARSVDFIPIDINTGKVRKSIAVNRADTVMRTLSFTLSNSGKPIDMDDVLWAEILIKKADNYEVDNGCVIAGKEIQYTLRSNDIAAVGTNLAQLMITYADGTYITTPTFEIVVYEKVMNPLVTASTNEYTSITQQLVQVTNLTTRAETAATNAESSSTLAQESADNAATSEDNAAASATEAVAAVADVTTLANAAASSATAAETSATNASTYATNAATSASNAESSATSAAASVTEASTYATNAQSSASDAATSATEAEASAIVAIEKATDLSDAVAEATTAAASAATSATNAASSATLAGTSATNAETSESNAATSATAAETSATAAGTSATNAAASEANAATSATSAQTYATNAETSATNAATSATNSASSATDAASSKTNAATSEANALDYAQRAEEAYRKMGEEGLVLGETSSTAYRGDRGATAYNHSQTTGNPHGTTYSDVGADVEGAAAAAYTQAAGYTDQAIADLINGAPSTLDTLKEIADAMAASEDVVDALEAAIGDKADEADFTGHANNSTIHITANERATWNAKQDALTNPLTASNIIDTLLSESTSDVLSANQGKVLKALNDALTTRVSTLEATIGYPV